MGRRMIYIIPFILIFIFIYGCSTDFLDEIKKKIEKDRATYTVTYIGNGNDSGTVPVDNNKYKKGDTVTVLGNPGDLTKSLYVLGSWNTSQDGTGESYEEGDTFIIGDSDVTLYAKWELEGSIRKHTLIGGNGDEKPYGILQTNDNGYIIAGWTSSTELSGPEPIYDLQGGNNNCYLVKLDSDLNIIWQTMVGGSGDDIFTWIDKTNDEGFIATGRSNSTDLVGPTPKMSNHGDFDCYIVKFNSSGNIEWQTMLGGTGYDYAYSARQTDDGGYIVAGWTNSTSVAGPELIKDYNGGTNDCYIVKLDSSGNITWQTMIGGNGWDRAFVISKTDDNGFIISGESDSTTVYGPALKVGNQGYRDYYIVKMDSSGTIIWQTMLGGSGDDFSHMSLQTTDGGFIVEGYSASYSVYGSGLIQGYQGGFDYYILKLKPDGSINWHTKLGGGSADRAFRLAIVNNDEYIITGYVSSTTVAGPPLIYNYHGGTYDCYVVKIDDSGNIVWQTMYGGTGTEGTASITQLKNGNYLLTCTTDSTNLNWDVPLSVSNHGGFDIYIAELW